jgi:hypothetical protein
MVHRRWQLRYTKFTGTRRLENSISIYIFKNAKLMVITLARYNLFIPRTCHVEVRVNFFHRQYLTNHSLSTLITWVNKLGYPTKMYDLGVFHQPQSPFNPNSFLNAVCTLSLGRQDVSVLWTPQPKTEKREYILLVNHPSNLNSTFYFCQLPPLRFRISPILLRIFFQFLLSPRS